MKQSPVTIVLKLQPATDPAAERHRLENVSFDFSKEPRLHFLSFCIAEMADKNALIIELNIDGKADDFIRDFAHTQSSFLDQACANCIEYDPAGRADSLSAAVIPTNMFHIGNTGRTLRRIHDEQKVHEAVKDLRQQLVVQSCSRERLWRRIGKELEPGLQDIANTTPIRPFLVRFNFKHADTREYAGAWLRILALAFIALFGAWYTRHMSATQWLLIAVPVGLVMGFHIYTLPSVMPKRLTGAWQARIYGLETGRILLGTVVPVLFLSAALGYIEFWKETVIVLAYSFSLMTAIVMVAVSAWLWYVTRMLWFAVVTFVAIAVPLVVLLLVLPAGSSGQVAFDILYASIGWLTAWSLFLAALTLFFFYRLRDAEETDWIDDTDVDDKQLPGVIAPNDDQQTQNHLASLTEIKAGPFRLALLKSVLRGINFFARCTENRGFLGGIGTIHFARFVTIEDRYLLFQGNYDGNWGSYLGDFKDIIGLTAVWTNTNGFPRSFLLLLAGGNFERQFKRYARNSQLYSSIWYSAYPGRTVQSIDRATETCRDLYRPVDRPGGGWFSAVRRVITKPMTEADLDTALRRLA